MTSDLLSESIKAQIDHWVAKYPEQERQSAVMQALTLVQDENNNSLTEPLMNAVADYLDMPKIAVYEVATFYSMYNLEPVGKHTIGICCNISCKLRKSDELLAYLKQKLSIEPGQTTPDGRYTLKVVECLGACIGAPVVQLDKDYHEHLTPEKVDNLLEKLAGGETHGS